MKKLFLSLAAFAAVTTMSAKLDLSENVSFGNIAEDGTVEAWAWCQSSSLSSGYWQYIDDAHSDSTWVSEYDYSDASAYDYIVVTFNQTTTGAKFVVVKNDWSIQQDCGTITAGAGYAAVATSELSTEENGSWANQVGSLVLHSTGAGILDVSGIYYMSSAELEDVIAQDALREKTTVKVTDWTVEMTDEDGSGWNYPGWIGEENLDQLYKTIVFEFSSVKQTTIAVVQSWPNGTLYRDTIAPSDEPVVWALPLSAMDSPGVGQIAIVNGNTTSYMIDSITGLPKRYTSPATATLSKFYYTSREDIVTTTVKGTMLDAYVIEADTTATVASPFEAGCKSLEGFKAVFTNSKLAIDANTALFGLDDEATASGDAAEYKSRFKMGGKSGSASYVTITVPTDGVLSISARSASSSAYDRDIMLTQNGETLLDELLMDGLGVVNDDEKVVYPNFSCRVKAGDITLTYPVGAVNIYAIAFGTDYWVKAEPEPEPEPEPTADGDETVIWTGEFACDGSWGTALMDLAYGNYNWANEAAGTVVRIYGHLNSADIAEWGKVACKNGSWGDLDATFSAWQGFSSFTDDSYVDATITQAVLDAYATDGGIVFTGYNVVITKVALIRPADDASALDAIETKAEASAATFNLLGQRTANGSKGFQTRGGKVIFIK